MKLEIANYSQKDARWKLKKVGTGTLSFGNVGCAVCCVTDILDYFKHKLTPDQLNDLLVSNNGFANGNLIKWDVVTKLFPDVVWKGRIDERGRTDLIDEYLKKSLPVIACVDYDPSDADLDQHFVVFIGKDEQGNYLINDPMSNSGDGAYYFQAKYGNDFNTIWGLRLYSGPAVVEEDNYKVVYKGQTLATYERNIIDQIGELDKQVKNLKETVSQQMQDNAILQTALTEQEKDNAEFIATIRLVEKERDVVKIELKEVQGLAKDILGIDECTAEQFRAVLGRYETLEKENKRLSKELENSQTDWQILLTFRNYALAKKRGESNA